MAFGAQTVAQYDVGFNVLLGPFRAQLGEAAGIYERTTGQMSTQSLRLATRQADLAKAVERYGAESTQAARKTIALRDEMASLAAAQNATATAAEKANVSLLSEERTIGRLARGGAVGSGLGRSGLLFGSGAFIGGLALATVLKTTLDAAKNEEVALAQLQVALKDTNISWAENKTRVEDALSSLIKTTAFTQTDLTTALANNVRRFGDVNLALRTTAIDADVARAKGIGLADAQNLVQRASLGQSRSLLALGIQFTKSTANVDALRATTKHATADQLANAKAADAQANKIAALAAVDARFHGNAARYLQTSAGKQALFNAELKHTEEIIGTALRPTFNRLITQFSNYIDRLNRTGRLQKDVNAVVSDVGAVFHLAGDAVHGLTILLNPLNNLLGGSANTVRDITAALIAFKIRGAAAFAAGAAEIEATAVPLIAAESAAAAGATLPAAAGGAGVVGRIAAYTGSAVVGAAAVGGRTSPLFSKVPLPASLFVLGDIGNEQGKVQHLGGPLDVVVSNLPGKGNGAFVTYRDPVTGKGHILKLAAGANIGNSIAADIQKNHPGFQGAPPSGPASRAGIGRGAATGAGNLGPPAPKKPPLVLGLTEAQQTALLRAEGTKSTADDVQALNAQLAILNRLVQQKGLNAAQLNSLLRARDSVLSQLDSLTAKSATASNKAQVAADRAFRHQESLLKDALARAKQHGNAAAVTKATQALSEFYKREAANPALSQATQDLARSREIGLKKASTAIDALIKHRESVLRLAVEKAKLTSPVADDIKAMKELEAFYKKEANNPKLSQAIRDAFRAKQVAEQVALQKLQKGATADFRKTEDEFLQAFTGIVGSYGSNVGSNPVTRSGKQQHITINQHFNAPPTASRYREAIYARVAVGAAFDS